MPKGNLTLLYCALILGVALGAQDAHAAAPKFSPPTSAVERNDQQLAALVNRVHRLANEFRAEHGRAALTLNAIISAEAREHSTEMARNPKGIGHRGFDQRLQDIRSKIPHRAAAENVAVNAGYDDPAGAAVEGWKQSPEHRKNMLGDFNLTGIGVTRGEDGRYFFTQIFIRTVK